jgi:hypothetical protein
VRVKRIWQSEAKQIDIESEVDLNNEGEGKQIDIESGVKFVY